jgi:hypothetical protein
MKIKTTKKLYKRKYQYNIVLVCAFGNVFRGSNTSKYKSRLDIENTNAAILSSTNRYLYRVDDLELANTLYTELLTISDYCTRIEYPTLTIYTNDWSDIIKLREINSDRVRSISIPPDNLIEGAVYMPTMDYEYRLTLGKTEKPYTDFIEWADAINKVKITNSCRDMLSDENGSYGGGHVYVTGENTLLIVKLQLSGIRLTIDRIVH